MKLKKNLKLTLTFALALFSIYLSGCENSSAKENNKEEIVQNVDKETVGAEEERYAEVIITDLEGNDLTIPSEINTIISLAPSITKSLINLDLGNKIIATDTYSVSIDGLSEDIQIFDMLSPDIESIVSLQPDIIFVSGMSRVGGEDPFSQAKKLGISIAYVPTANSLAEIKESIIFVGKAVNKGDEGQKISQKFDDKINEIKTKIENENVEEKSAYFEISPSPNLYSFGEGVFLNEILEILNTKNIFAEQESWISVTEEEVLSRNPQVIFTNTFFEDPVSEIINRRGWESIDAVKNNQVYKVDSNNSSQSNEFVVLAIEEMAKSLYPEIFN